MFGDVKLNRADKVPVHLFDFVLLLFFFFFFFDQKPIKWTHQTYSFAKKNREIV